MSRSIAVLGLGRFGKKLALSLYDMGEEVMAIDKNAELVEAVSGGVTYAVEADVSNADALKGVNIGDMDTVVVAMGSDLTASIMAVMVSKEQGVPHVIAKAADERMGEILKKVGADKIIFPEEFRLSQVVLEMSYLLLLRFHYKMQLVILPLFLPLSHFP